MGPNTMVIFRTAQGLFYRKKSLLFFLSEINRWSSLLDQARTKCSRLVEQAPHIQIETWCKRLLHKESYHCQYSLHVAKPIL